MVYYYLSYCYDTPYIKVLFNKFKNVSIRETYIFLFTINYFCVYSNFSNGFSIKTFFITKKICKIIQLKKYNILRLIYLFLLFVLVGFSQENTHTVYFDTDLSKVTNIEENRLLSFIASLSEKNVLSIEIFGFCDDLGASSYNLSLSQRRAEEIKKILQSQMVKSLINADTQLIDQKQP